MDFGSLYLLVLLVVLSSSVFSVDAAGSEELLAKEKDALKACCTKHYGQDLVHLSPKGLPFGKSGICTYFHTDEEKAYVELRRFTAKQKKTYEEGDSYGDCCDTSSKVNPKFFRCVVRKIDRLPGVGKNVYVSDPSEKAAEAVADD